MIRRPAWATIRSLRVRLLKNLMLAIVLVWATWFGCQTVQMARTQSGHWDGMMRAIGQQILRSVPPSVTLLGAQPGLRLPPGIAALPEHLSYQIWHRDGHVVLRSADAPAAPLAPLRFERTDWFGTSEVAGEPWRVYTITDDSGQLQVQVAKRQAWLDAELASWRDRSLVVAGLLVVLLGTVSWLTICWTMRPVHRVRDALSRRAPLDLTPVPAAELPQELRPLVEGFNAVLAQLDTALQAERHFLADAAHELRTPLAVLTAQARVVHDAPSLAESRLALVPLVAGIERTARLTEQLLDSARLDAFAPPAGRPPAALHEIVSLVVHDFAGEARARRQRLALDLAPCALPLCVDAVGVLLRNLLDNAVRYSGDGARIQVQCGPVQEGGRWHVALAVHDDGPGVPADQRDRIFDRFYRVPGTAARGSGIGLSLVARIAALHGARIDTGTGLGGRGFGITLTFTAHAAEPPTPSTDSGPMPLGALGAA